MKSGLVICVMGIMLAGCGATPRTVTGSPDWGTGVRDPGYVREKAARLLANDSLEHRHIRAMAMMRAMTWQQACYVYRTASTESGIKELMVMALIEGRESQFIGRSKREIANLLGPPDARWNEDDDWYYSGTGRVSDSSVAFGLSFSQAGRVDGWIYPN